MVVIAKIRQSAVAAGSPRRINVEIGQTGGDRTAVVDADAAIASASSRHRAVIVIPRVSDRADDGGACVASLTTAALDPVDSGDSKDLTRIADTTAAVATSSRGDGAGVVFGHINATALATGSSLALQDVISEGQIDDPTVHDTGATGTAVSRRGCRAVGAGDGHVISSGSIASRAGNGVVTGEGQQPAPQGDVDAITSVLARRHACHAVTCDLIAAAEGVDSAVDQPGRIVDVAGRNVIAEGESERVEVGHVLETSRSTIAIACQSVWTLLII